LLCAGAALATLVRSQSALSAVTDIGGLFLTVVGGAMVPLSLLPRWLAAAAPAPPRYWALHSLQAAVARGPRPPLPGGAVRSAAPAAGARGLLAAGGIGRGWGRSHLL